MFTTEHFSAGKSSVAPTHWRRVDLISDPENRALTFLRQENGDFLNVGSCSAYQKRKMDAPSPIYSM